MKVLTDILTNIKEDLPVREVRRGIFWTAVASKHCGLASTMMYESCAQENNDSNYNLSFTEKTALELAQLVFSESIFDASVGLAAINSLLDIDESRCIDINAGELLIRMGVDKNVSVIGHFPFSEELRRVAKNLWIIEKRLKPGDYPEWDAQIYLPKSDIIAISSTTLINHTFHEILNLCPESSIKMLLGPSTPMSSVFFNYGIHIISGSKVVDEKKALQYISEGANFRQLKRTGAIKLVTLMQKDMLKRGGNEI